MTETGIEERSATKHEPWRERLAAQERSGLSVKQFCKEQGLTEYSCYAWRKRLRREGPVRFALVDRGAVRQEPATEARLELVLWEPRKVVRMGVPPLRLEIPGAGFAAAHLPDLGKHGEYLVGGVGRAAKSGSRGTRADQGVRPTKLDRPTCISPQIRTRYYPLVLLK